MQAINQTTQQVLASHVQVADHYFARLVGLMGKPGLPQGHGLWIVPCADIHSFFMRFAFDAVFVDKDGVVLHIIEAMKPWRISKFVRGSRVVLELPAGVLAQTGTQPGHKIMLMD